MARNKEKVVHPQALMDYLDRIGAEVLSFRRAMVKEYAKGDNYYIERTLIKISADGSIECSRKEHAPTAAEVEAIKAAFVGIDFPVSIGASRAAYKKWVGEQSGDRSRFYELFDRRAGTIRMVQERVQKDDGTKAFYSWSFWSDGQWRAMEPDGLLPFWKPEKRLKARIMIHEGCKGAKFIHDLVIGKGDHPWRDMLELYEHWGMIGGALVPHRTDYDELRRERPAEVIYVCDNDHAGESALQNVSKCYGLALKGIMFGNNFKVAWDMADPMPEHLFTAEGRYKGPELAQLVRPATRATELVGPVAGEKGRSTAVLKNAFKEEWVHCITPEVFIHRDWPNEIYAAPEFNNKVAPFSDVDDTARLLKKDAASKSTKLKYDPGKAAGIYGEDGRYINTHTPTLIKAEKGDAGPWIEFLEKLIPIEKDRVELMRWCATLIARPDIKMLYGVLLISETQGIGKGTLGEKILAPLVGEENVSYPNESEIVDSSFNHWLAHKRLAVVHEIYAGHSSKAYNKLKSVITDRYITVNKKYQTNYSVENWMHIFACSNSIRAIQLSSDDRRWFVPKVVEDKQSNLYWIAFNEWLTEKGGLGIIKWWAQEWVKKNTPVLKGNSAPWSSAKAEVIEEGYSPGMTLVASVLDKVKEVKNGDDVLIFDGELVQIIRDHIYDGRPSDRLERPLTLRKIAKQKGWFIHPDKVWVPRNSIRGKLICSSKRLAEMGSEDLLKEVPVLEIGALAREWFPM